MNYSDTFIYFKYIEFNAVKTGMLFCEAKNYLGNDSASTAILFDDDLNNAIKIYSNFNSPVAVGSEVEMWCFSERFENIHWNKS